jgi:uncharacterized membrane protein YbaN (DUF454 family)
VTESDGRAGGGAADSRALRIALIVAGTLCVGLGAAGIVLPVLPTTPFLLVAAACFARSSPRLHSWLLQHRRLGPYVAGFVDGRGMPASKKRVAIGVLWLFIAGSAAIILVRAGLTAASGAIAVTLLLVAVLVTRHILRLRTLPDRADPPDRVGPGDPRM